MCLYAVEISSWPTAIKMHHNGFRFPMNAWIRVLGPQALRTFIIYRTSCIVGA